MDSSTSSFVHLFRPGASNAQVLLLLHGTGGNEEDLIPLAREISPDSSTLSPRGKVLENGMPRFFRRLAEGVFDLEDLRFRTQELADFIVACSKSYGFELEQVLAIGYSNGANMAASLLLLRPEVLKGAILFRATLPLKPSTLPELSGKAVLICAGRFDQIIPEQGTLELADTLRRAGASVELSREEADHSLVAADLAVAKAWVEKNFSLERK